MIVARGLVVGIGSSEILHGVDVHIPSGQITALVGANGAGKTTLLRTLSRLLPLRRGTIVFDGETIDRFEPHEIARRGLVHVPQGRMIIPGLTVEENLRIGANRVPDLKPAEIDRMLEREYQRFPVLKSRRAVLGTSLSGGEQQMLAVSRALMMKPKLIMLDEPFSAVDPIAVEDLQREVVRLKEEFGKSVLITDHNVAQTLRVCDRALIINDGRVFKEGTPREIINDAAVRSAYLGNTFRGDEFDERPEKPKPQRPRVTVQRTE